MVRQCGDKAFSHVLRVTASRVNELTYI